MAVSGPYTLAGAASTSQLTGYLRGGSSAQPIRALIYADNGSGAPGAFVAASQQVTVAAGAAPPGSSFPFASSVSLPAGTYWLGYWFGGSEHPGLLRRRRRLRPVRARLLLVDREPAGELRRRQRLLARLLAVRDAWVRRRAPPANTGCRRSAARRRRARR